MHSIYNEIVSYEIMILKSLNSIPLEQNAFGKSIVLPVDLIEQKPMYIQNQLWRYDCEDYQATTQKKEGLIGPAMSGVPMSSALHLAHIGAVIAQAEQW